VNDFSDESTKSVARRFRSGDCVIDLSTRTVICDGTRVDVEAKVFDLIELLLLHRNRALSKRELGDALWGDRPVTDAALSQLLRKARRALGDNGEAQRYIRTVHGRGLQWTADVEVDMQASESRFIPEPIETPLPRSTAQRNELSNVPQPSGKSPWNPLAILLALLLVSAPPGLHFALKAERTRVANSALHTAPVRIQILPTRNTTAQPDLEWAGTGLMGLMSSLIRSESGVEVLFAASRNSSEDLANIDIEDATSLQRLREASGATHVVASELYELVISVVAIDGSVIQRDQLRGSSPAALAADAAERIRAHFHSQSSDRESQPLSEIRDPFVAEVYARGLDAQLRGDQTGARKYFEICLDHQADLLWPRLHLATAQMAVGDSAAARENIERVASDAQRRGLATLHIQALRQLANMAFRAGDLDRAAEHLNLAMREIYSIDQPLLRSDLLVAHGSIESERANWGIAVESLNEALRIALSAGDRRREANALSNLAVVDNASGDSEAAIKRLRAALEAARSARDGALETSILLNIGGAEYNSGRPLEAAAMLKQSLRLAKKNGDRQAQVFSTVMLSWILAAFDYDEEARRLAEGVAALAESDANPFWKAEAYWALSNLASRQRDWSAALNWLAQVSEIHRALGMTRNSGPILADIVQAQVEAGDIQHARESANAFRALLDAHPDDSALRERLAVVDAQLRYAEGDRAGAMQQLSSFLQARPRDQGPAVQAAMFQLAQWQLAAADNQSLLDESAWTTWLASRPDALKLRIKALTQSGQREEAALESTRFQQLRAADALQLDADLFVIP
jgi:DNA-binding winged helix-turn-helix (wHTH) protein/tetratricopeptide (TPR) repeat protein